MRSNRLLTHNGRTQTMAQWARESGMKDTTLGQRLAKGWTIDEAIEYRAPRTPHIVMPKRLKLSRSRRPAFFELHKGTCCLCRQSVSPNEPWHEEHILARCLGGGEELSNRGIAHRACAIEKTKIDKAEWWKRRRQHAMLAARVLDAHRNPDAKVALLSLSHAKLEWRK